MEAVRLAMGAAPGPLSAALVGASPNTRQKRSVSSAPAVTTLQVAQVRWQSQWLGVIGTASAEAQSCKPIFEHSPDTRLFLPTTG
jgi:hypothetical protein